jgi:riboflavin kinase/FMN adenylyltransferase
MISPEDLKIIGAETKHALTFSINMEVIYNSDFSKIQTETIATIGFFDGVHEGHRYLINQLKKRGQENGLKTAVVTFPIHPRKVLQKNYQPYLLNSFEERINRLSTLGIDYCHIIDFTPELAEFSAENFMQKILFQQFKVKELLIGYDHRFGKGRVNEFIDYQLFGEKIGIKVHQAEKLQQENNYVSSTVIRHSLTEGNVEHTAKYLSYYYTLQGKVIRGDELGRTIGFPTANLELTDNDKLIPSNGIYAVWIKIDEKCYAGMAYIGNRPTVSSAGEKRIEVHIFDFSQDIYDKNISIEFVKFIRQDILFDNLKDLQTQLEKDREQSMKILQN